MKYELKVVEYFETEYERAVELLNISNRPNWVEPHTVINNALQRCLGVCEFAQGLGIDFVLIESLYEDYRGRFNALLEGC